MLDNAVLEVLSHKLKSPSPCIVLIMSTIILGDKMVHVLSQVYYQAICKKQRGNFLNKLIIYLIRIPSGNLRPIC